MPSMAPSAFDEHSGSMHLKSSTICAHFFNRFYFLPKMALPSSLPLLLSPWKALLWLSVYWRSSLLLQYSAGALASLGSYLASSL